MFPLAPWVSSLRGRLCKQAPRGPLLVLVAMVGISECLRVSLFPCSLVCCLALQRASATGEESASFIPGPPEPKQPRPGKYVLAGWVLYGQHFPGHVLWREGKPLFWDKAFHAQVGLGNMTLDQAKGLIYCRTSQTLQVFPNPQDFRAPFFLEHLWSDHLEAV